VLSANPATACTSANAPPSLTGAGSGTATYTAASSGSVLLYTRSTTSPLAAVNNPFTANISLSVNATDSNENGVSGNPGNGVTAALTSTTALAFNGGGTGIAFDAGAGFRYGRARFFNSVGLLNVGIPVPLRVEYYTGTAFTTNTLDSCTTFAAGNFALSNYQGGISAGNMNSTNISISGAVAQGVSNLTLTKPNPAATTPGSVRICLDLDSGVTGDLTCQASTPANKTYLQGNWTSTQTYDKDPNATAAWGLFGSQPNNFIYFRENY
jgi:hypothetical protein